MPHCVVVLGPVKSHFLVRDCTLGIQGLSNINLIKKSLSKAISRILHSLSMHNFLAKMQEDFHLHSLGNLRYVNPTPCLNGESVHFQKFWKENDWNHKARARALSLVLKWYKLNEYTVKIIIGDKELFLGWYRNLDLYP